tara:strand:+ start:737 stop:1594 length:858 start_codon:yes stop_codon:yes gene_type:complete
MAIIEVKGRVVESLFNPECKYKSWVLNTSDETITFNIHPANYLYQDNTSSVTHSLNDLIISHVSIGSWRITLDCYYTKGISISDRFSGGDSAMESIDPELFEKLYYHSRKTGHLTGPYQSETRFDYGKTSHGKAKDLVEFLKPYADNAFVDWRDVNAHLFPLQNWELLLIATDNGFLYADSLIEHIKVSHGNIIARQIKENNVLLSNGSINPEWIASLQLPTSVLELVIENQREQGFDTSKFASESNAGIENDDIVKKLQELAELKEKGLIDEEEFKAAKNKLLE